MMKTPLCERCLESEKLCADCKKKLEDGLISETEIKVSRFLYNLSKEHPSLRDIVIKKTFTDEDEVVILVRKGDASKVIGRGGDVAKKISKELRKKNIKVIEEEKDFKQFVQSIISPARLKGINILYLPTKELYRVRINKSDRARVHDLWLQVVRDKSPKPVQFVFD